VPKRVHRKTTFMLNPCRGRER